MSRCAELRRSSRQILGASEQMAVIDCTTGGTVMARDVSRLAPGSISSTTTQPAPVSTGAGRDDCSTAYRKAKRFRAWAARVAVEGFMCDETEATRWLGKGGDRCSPGFGRRPTRRRKLRAG